jgi:hypothetical protein
MSVIRFETAQEVFETFPDLREDISTKATEEHPLAFLQRLQGGATPEDAITFLAHLLPRRYAVYWACGCVRALEQGRDLDSIDAMQAALAWLREPEESNRLRALAIGMQAERSDSTTWLALSAAWSGGNISPAAQGGVVQPPPHLTAVAARAAVLIALARVGSAARAENIQRVLEHGKKLAAGGDRPGSGG